MVAAVVLDRVNHMQQVLQTDKPTCVTCVEFQTDNMHPQDFGDTPTKKPVLVVTYLLQNLPY